MRTAKVGIAVVDDDPSFARAIGRLLRAAGFEALIYSSAEAFLEAGADLPADCLLLDIHLPGMSGLELSRRLKDLGMTVPVIFITAHDDPRARAEAREAGAVGYLCKPVPGELLLQTIAKAVDARADAGSPARVGLPVFST